MLRNVKYISDFDYLIAIKMCKVSNMKNQVKKLKFMLDN